jgi:hypothetical protein
MEQHTVRNIYMVAALLRIQGRYFLKLLKEYGGGQLLKNQPILEVYSYKNISS